MGEIRHVSEISEFILNSFVVPNSDLDTFFSLMLESGFKMDAQFPGD